VRSKLTSRNFAVQFLFVAALFLAGIRQEYLQDSCFSVVFHSSTLIQESVEGRTGPLQECSSTKTHWGFLGIEGVDRNEKEPEGSCERLHKCRTSSCEPRLFLRRIGSFLK
jgi:hypothetical protein